MHEAHDRARARHRLYGLLGRLIATGRVDDVADTVRALPALAAVHEGGPDIAAAHHQWLAYELSAHESAFVDGALEGPATAEVRATYEAIGFHPGRRDLAPDHLGLELAAMAHLCAMEREALVDGHDPAPVLALQQRMVAHLQRWLPLLAATVQGCWADVVGLADELVAAEGHAPPPLPPEPERLDATSLLVPCEVGWVCTWRGLRAAGEACAQPLGFGSKRRALRTLLDSEEGRKALADRIDLAVPAPWSTRAQATRARLLA